MHIQTTSVADGIPFDPSSVTIYPSDIGNHFSWNTTTQLWEINDQIAYHRQVALPDSFATTLNGTLTMNTTQNAAIILTGTATGYSVQLPAANLLNVGQKYEIYNTTNQPISVKDNAGTVLTILSQNSVGYGYLQLNGTAAGTWLWWQVLLSSVASGIISYNVVSNTTFSSNAAVDTLITGMSVVPQSGTYGVWANFELTGTGSGQQVDTTIYNGASAVADSKRSNLSTSGAHIFSSSTQTISSYNGTYACALYINPNSNSFTVGARSLLLIRLGT